MNALLEYTYFSGLLLRKLGNVSHGSCCSFPEILKTNAKLNKDMPSLYCQKFLYFNLHVNGVLLGLSEPQLLGVVLALVVGLRNCR